MKFIKKYMILNKIEGDCMVVFINNFRNLLNWKSTLIYIVVMSILPTIIGSVLKSEIYDGSMSMASQIDFTIGIYYILVFMWVLGIPFLIVASAKGIGLISNEISEGTLGLLVSMKISRYQIVLYKWITLYLVILLLGILGIFTNITIISTVANMDNNIKALLIESVPQLIKYLILIGFIFSTLAILLSLLIKSKVVAIVSITFYIVIIFLIIPLFKNFLFSYYEKFFLYYLDLNYQFSLMYYYFINGNNNIFTPAIQSVVGIFIGIFDLKKVVDNDLSILTGSTLMKTAPVYPYLDAFNLIIFWLSFGVMSLIISIRILTKRDIT